MQRLFPLGGPVAPEDVVDREDFIEELATRLHEGQSVVLAGPRRIGKSSVALEVLRRLAERGTKTVALNLEETSTPREFAAKLATECLGHLSRGARAVQSAESALGELLRGTSLRAKLLDVEVEALRHPADRSTEEYLDQALSLPEAVAARTHSQMVVLLDEFQITASLGGEALMRRMRGHFQQQRHTAFLFLGSAMSLMGEMFGQSRRPFYRFATPLDLPPVSDDAWRPYLTTRYRARGLDIGPDAVDRMLAKTGGHPYDTMQVAFEAFLLAQDTSPTVDVPIVEAGYAMALEHLATTFEYDVERCGATARMLLARVAKHQPLYEDVSSSDTARRAIRSLVEGGYLQRLGHGRYAFREPMLADHLRGW